jgi:hypothetical protein
MVMNEEENSKQGRRAPFFRVVDTRRQCSAANASLHIFGCHSREGGNPGVLLFKEKWIPDCYLGNDERESCHVSSVKGLMTHYTGYSGCLGLHYQ